MAQDARRGCITLSLRLTLHRGCFKVFHVTRLTGRTTERGNMHPRSPCSNRHPQKTTITLRLGTPLQRTASADPLQLRHAAATDFTLGLDPSIALHHPPTSRNYALSPPLSSTLYVATPSLIPYTSLPPWPMSPRTSLGAWRGGTWTFFATACA